MRRSFVLVAVLFWTSWSAPQRVDGFIPITWDKAADRLLLEIPALGEDVLHFVSTAHGLGSVELGLDRGIEEQMVVRMDPMDIRYAFILWVNRDERGSSRTRGMRRRTTAARSAAPPSAWRSTPS